MSHFRSFNTGRKNGTMTPGMFVEVDIRIHKMKNEQVSPWRTSREADR